MVPLNFFVIDVSYKRTSFSTTYKFEFCIPQLPWPQCALRCGIFKEWKLYCFGVMFFLQVKKKRKKLNCTIHILCFNPIKRILIWQIQPLSGVTSNCLDHNHILKIKVKQSVNWQKLRSPPPNSNPNFAFFNCCLNFSGSVCLCCYRS